jgi:aspartyl-tRNA(Asn)/glutamyl-tRNA(Gln) amidotransferase subunit A
MLTIHQAARLLRSRELSAVQLLESSLERIDRFESKVRAWVFVDREAARQAAERADREIAAGQWRGPLHGIPLGIKDIFDVFDWPTAGGSQLWAQSIARQDCTVVSRLRQSGAVFIGKTVTTAFASFDPPVTRNPWDLTRTPGGSSSGSAAALACGMCLGALGSQTGGSITRPASFCGVAGLKPTHGRVSGAGVMPLAPSMDHPGPMARCVRDLAILLQAIAGKDHLDPDTADQPVPDYLAHLDRVPELVLGRVRGLFEDRADPEMIQVMDEICGKLSKHGATICDVALPAGFSEVIARHRTIMAVEAAAYHAERLHRHPEDYPPRITALIEEGLAAPATHYARCRDFQRRLAGETAARFGPIRAFLCPATVGPAPDAGSTGDPAFNSPWSLTGFPTVNIPVGKSQDGLPLGLQLVGPPWREGELLSIAEWCEKKLAVEMGEPSLTGI